MIPTIHPFPARMAPDLALDMFDELAPASRVLDPMSGSGTVLRQASEMGFHSIGFDLDPLAVLMSRAWTTPVCDKSIGEIAGQVSEMAKALCGNFVLPWIDRDTETKEFIRFWFGKKQRSALRKLALAMHQLEVSRLGPAKRAALDVVRIALSRTIVTKEQGASLARDASHSRPHKVAEESDFDVFAGLDRSLRQVRRRLIEHPPWGGTEISIGDARSLATLEDGEIDAVLTSPPYLNAIDYLRGHRLSLVWFGHTLSSLRDIRSKSIGAERAPDAVENHKVNARISKAICDLDQLAPRYQAMVQRYAEDTFLMMSEISRVTKAGGLVTLVVGNSCLKGHFIKNSSGVESAAKILRMKLLWTKDRELPGRSRYLPVTATGSLAARMRTETVLTFGRT